MRVSGLGVCVFGVSLVVAACGGSPEGTARETGTIDVNRSDTSATATSGTEDRGVSQEGPAAEVLPDSASPLALVGVIGALSLLGAATTRLLRRG